MDCYNTGVIQERKATYDKDNNPNGRWRCFKKEEFNVEAEKDNSLILSGLFRKKKMKELLQKSLMICRQSLME